MTDDGWIHAAVADGAGSARLSHIGAKAFVDAVVSQIYHGRSPEPFDADRIASCIVTSVNQTRAQLVNQGNHRQNGSPPSLSDFAATLIVAVANLNSGAFFHVGDGAGTAFNFVNNSDVTLSKPQNGEYANETYFLTMDNWENYLRITPFIKNDIVVFGLGVLLFIQNHLGDGPGPNLEYLRGMGFQPLRAAVNAATERPRPRQGKSRKSKLSEFPYSSTP